MLSMLGRWLLVLIVVCIRITFRVSRSIFNGCWIPVTGVLIVLRAVIWILVTSAVLRRVVWDSPVVILCFSGTVCRSTCIHCRGLSWCALDGLRCAVLLGTRLTD